MAANDTVVSGDADHAQSELDEIIRYMEEHADAELTQVEMVL